jgi:hypothetical protein
VDPAYRNIVDLHIDAIFNFAASPTYHSTITSGLRRLYTYHSFVIGGKVTLGGLERWFSPRGQDLAFLLSCIGLVRPSSSADLKQNKTKPFFCSASPSRRRLRGSKEEKGSAGSGGVSVGPG